MSEVAHLVVTAEIRRRMTICMCDECRAERYEQLTDSDLIGVIEGALMELHDRGYKFTDDDHDERLFFERNGRTQ